MGPETNPFHLVPLSTNNGLPGKNGRLYYAYSGPSMYPTLKPSDLLEVHPIQSDNFQIGDVILYPNPLGDGNVVHRIISKKGHSLVTCGDNNSNIDAYQLIPNQLIVHVTAIWRGQKYYMIPGGKIGVLIFHFHQWTRKLRMILNNQFSSPYQALVRNHFLAHLWYPRLNLKIIRYASPIGPIYRLFNHKKSIGIYAPPLSEWIIYPPYRLIIDESKLPHPEKAS